MYLKILIITPPLPELIIAGIEYLDIKNIGLRLIFITLSQYLSFSLTTDVLLAIPILLSRISSLFHLLITSFTTFLHSVVLVKSAPIAKAFPPLF